MSPRQALRVAVAGATGSLGGEILSVLEARHFPLGELVPIATDRSGGDAIEVHGEVYEVRTDANALRGADIAFLCTPQAASLDLARWALHERVPCIDLSGALAGASEVPLLAADLEPAPEALRAPLISACAGPALAWALVLSPLARVAALRRVVGTLFLSASSGGRQGIEALSSETIALFNQQDLPEPGIFGQPVAFDCVPAVGSLEDGGGSALELDIARQLARVLRCEVGTAATVVRVPTFAGDGSALAIELGAALPIGEALAALDKAPGVELWAGSGSGPTTRATAGRDVVLVGRLRADPTVEHGLLCWLAVDAIRLAAANAVKLAEARLALS